MDLGFGPEPRPLALAIRRSLGVAATTVGYHSVGMKPMARSDWPEVSLLRSNTATESEMALAENRVFSSGERARYSGSPPPYCCPGSLVERYETGLPVAVSRTAISSRSVSATKSLELSRLRRSAVG